MTIRTAKKVLRRWRRGEGSYADNKFGTVIRAATKLVSYELRRGRVIKNPLPAVWWSSYSKR